MTHAHDVIPCDNVVINHPGKCHSRHMNSRTMEYLCYLQRVPFRHDNDKGWPKKDNANVSSPPTFSADFSVNSWALCKRLLYLLYRTHLLLTVLSVPTVINKCLNSSSTNLSTFAWPVTFSCNMIFRVIRKYRSSDKRRPNRNILSLDTRITTVKKVLDTSRKLLK